MTSKTDPKTDAVQRAALVTGGAKKQFGVDVILISVIPLLALTVEVVNSAVTTDEVSMLPRVVLGFTLLLMCLGCVLLLKYPRTIIRLRRYLKQVMDGEAPDAGALVAAEDDIDAIAKHLDVIVDAAREQVTTIQNQQEELVQAEQQRVMLDCQRDRHR